MRSKKGWLLAPFLSAAMIGIGPPDSRADVVELKGVVPELGTERAANGSASEALDRAIDHFQRKEYQPALEWLRAACNRDPSLPPDRLMLARMFLLDNQTALGRGSLELAAVERPGYPGVYLAFAELAIKEGRITDAQLHLEKAETLCESTDLHPQRRRYFLARCRTGKAGVAEGRKDWPGARAALVSLLTIEPKNVPARLRLARALFELGLESECLEQLSQARKDDPSQEPAASALGWLYSNKKGDDEKAGEWLRRATEQEPKDPRTHIALATWLLHRGQIEAALAQVEAGAKLSPEGKEPLALRGLIARYQKNYTLAESSFQAALRLSPGDPELNNQLALSLIEQPDNAKRLRALQLADANARLAPENPQVLATLGWVQYRLGKLDDAERLLKKAISGGKANSETAYFLSHVLVDRGLPSKARDLLNAALEAPGSFPYRQDAQAMLARLPTK